MTAKKMKPVLTPEVAEMIRALRYARDNDLLPGTHLIAHVIERLTAADEFAGVVASEAYVPKKGYRDSVIAAYGRYMNAGKA